MKLSVKPIDIEQLPIPYWDLACPNCAYSLNGLPAHRCPECGTFLDMKEVIQTYSKLRDPLFTGNELPLPDFSLHCKKCQAPLTGAHSFHCPQCSRPFDPQRWRPRHTWFKLTTRMCQDIPQEVAIALIDDHYIPYIVEQSRDPFGTSSTRVLVAREFFFDLLLILSQARSTAHNETRADAPTTWLCHSCQEQNPGHFERCWRCEQSKNGETPQ